MAGAILRPPGAGSSKKLGIICFTKVFEGFRETMGFISLCPWRFRAQGAHASENHCFPKVFLGFEALPWPVPPSGRVAPGAAESSESFDFPRFVKDFAKPCCSFLFAQAGNH